MVGVDTQVFHGDRQLRRLRRDHRHRQRAAARGAAPCRALPARRQRRRRGAAVGAGARERARAAVGLRRGRRSRALFQAPDDAQGHKEYALNLNAFGCPQPLPGASGESGGSRRSAPGTPTGAARRTERDARHRLPHRGRADAGDRRWRTAVGPRAAKPNGSRASPRSSIISAASPSTSRAATMRWSARFFASRTTPPVPPASFSSTMSAISACAATARLAWRRRWRIWVGSGQGAIDSKPRSESSGSSLPITVRPRSIMSRASVTSGA